MKWKIPLFKIHWDEDDIKAVTKVISRGNYWATGPEIEEFEKGIAEYVGSRYAVSFNSGTSALQTLLMAYGIKDKEVIVPTFTFIATANTVVVAGGKPVFGETEEDTYGLDIEDVKKRITKDTVAIINIDYAGIPSKYNEDLRRLADEKGIIYIEDAAEALGSSINGKKTGTFGHSAIFSFCQNKIITTGEGGMIVTDDEEIYQKAKLLRSHGRLEEEQDYFSSTGDNDYIEAGYNFRMSSMTAALGLSQLKKIEKIIEARNSHAQYLNIRLSEIRNIKIISVIEGYRYVYQLYTIEVDEKERDALQKHLEKKGIMSKVYFNPVHLKSFYRKRFGYKKEDLPKTNQISKKVLTLPIYVDMSKDDLDMIAGSIKEFYEG